MQLRPAWIPLQICSPRPAARALRPPLKRLSWEMRVILWNCRKVTMKKIYKTEGAGGCCSCCYDLCAPPNQSDIKLIAGMSGSKQAPQATDTHLRSTDGDGMFNYRCVFDLDLPSPKMLCNLKVQVWNSQSRARHRHRDARRRGLSRLVGDRAAAVAHDHSVSRCTSVFLLLFLLLFSSSQSTGTLTTALPRRSSRCGDSSRSPAASWRNRPATPTSRSAAYRDSGCT